MANTTKISLPEPLSSYVAAQVESGAYDSPQSFVEDLVAGYQIRLERTLGAASDQQPIAIREEQWASGDIVRIAQDRLTLRK